MGEHHEDEEVGPRADGPRAAPRRAGQRGPVRPRRRSRRRRRHRAPGPPGLARHPGNHPACCVTAPRGGASGEAGPREREVAPAGKRACPHHPSKRARRPPKLESHNLFQINQGHTSGNRLLPPPLPLSSAREEKRGVAVASWTPRRGQGDTTAPPTLNTSRTTSGRGKEFPEQVPHLKIKFYFFFHPLKKSKI